MATRRRSKSTRPRAARTSTRRATPRTPQPGLLHDLGVMRVILVIIAVIEVVAAPASGTPPAYSGWEMWPTLLVPTFAPIVFMVLMLDALMGRVMLGSAKGQERERYRRIVIVNLVAGIVLLARWIPYFAALGR